MTAIGLPCDIVIVRDIVAQFELSVRSNARGLHSVAETEALELLTNGIPVLITHQEQRRVAMVAAWQKVDSMRERVKALRRVSVIMMRVLRAIGGTPLVDPDEPPPTPRQVQSKRHAKCNDYPDEREPIELTHETIESHARANGLFVEEPSP